MSSSYIFVSSNDRTYASAAPGDFQVAINSSLADSPRSSLSIENITFFNLEYGVNSNNNTLQFRENSNDGTTYTVTVTPGNYGSSDFVAALKASMDAAASNIYTVSYSSTTGKLIIAVILPNTFKLVGGAMLTNVMGYEPMTTFAAVKGGDYPVNLAGTSFVDVTLGLSNKNIVSGSGQYRPFMRVPIAVGFGNLVEFTNFSDNDDVLIATDDLDQLRITLYNDRRRVYDLPLNAVVSIVLKVKSIF